MQDRHKAGAELAVYHFWLTPFAPLTPCQTALRLPAESPEEMMTLTLCLSCDLAKALVRNLVIAECEATKRGRETKDELNAVKKLLQALCPGTKISTQDVKDCLP